MVVGGGPAGVEVAAEIVEAHAGKQVTLVHPGAQLLNGTPPKAGAAAKKWLESHRVTVLLNTSVQGKRESSAACDCEGTVVAPVAMRPLCDAQLLHRHAGARAAHSTAYRTLGLAPPQINTHSNDIHCRVHMCVPCSRGPRPRQPDPGRQGGSHAGGGRGAVVRRRPPQHRLPAGRRAGGLPGRARRRQGGNTGMARGHYWTSSGFIDHAALCDFLLHC